MDMPTRNKRTQVFISYSHRDKKWLDQLTTALRPYVRDNLVDVWDDTRTKPGDKWKDEIRKALASAKVAVLMVSQDFLASEFIANNELPPLLKAAENEGLTILWIPLTASAYKITPISEYQSAIEPRNTLDSLPPHKRRSELVKNCELIHTAANQKRVLTPEEVSATMLRFQQELSYRKYGPDLDIMQAMSELDHAKREAPHEVAAAEARLEQVKRKVAERYVRRRVGELEHILLRLPTPEEVIESGLPYPYYLPYEEVLAIIKDVQSSSPDKV